MPWKVVVTTENGEERSFTALETYVLTPEQKLLWQTLAGGEQKVTNARIKYIRERMIKEDGNEKNDRSGR